MKISVITPVYNAQKDIRKCIESILNQSFTDFELLLINDGSTDNSGEICDEYAKKDTRIKVFHQENRGPSAARNKGIDEMKGDFVTFIDADDYVEPFYLGAFVSHGFDITNSIVIQGYSWENDKGKKQEYKCQQKQYANTEYSELFYSTNLIQRHPFACIKLFPAHIIKETPIYFDEEIKFGEDFIFVLQCIKHSESIIWVEKAGYHYQYNDNSLTRTIYNFESEIKRSNTARDLLADIAEQFSFDEKTITFHKTYIKRYFYRAVYSLYLNYPRKKRRERVACLRKGGDSANLELMTQYNTPNTGFTKGFKFLFGKRLFNLLDLYILLWFKLRKTGLEKLSNRK